jgi:hypothetical protein
MRKKADGAKKGKGRNYFTASVNILLTLIEDMLPFGNASWELLAFEYNANSLRFRILVHRFVNDKGKFIGALLFVSF